MQVRWGLGNHTVPLDVEETGPLPGYYSAAAPGQPRTQHRHCSGAQPA